MKTLTVVCPAYNEAEGIETFYNALADVLSDLREYTSDVVFVVDGGEDATFEILSEIAKKDLRVSVVKFSRNFGHQAALVAGIERATGDAVITMDSDLQHPPELIPSLVAAYEKGSDIVYTVRENEKINPLRKIAGNIFYWLMGAIADVTINANSSDFRLLSRKVVFVLKEHIHERDVFLRGMTQWIGFQSTTIAFTPQKRVAGVSGYSFSKLVSFALSGVVSFSKKPLRAAAVIGALFALLGIVFIVNTIFEYFVYGTLPPGWASVVILLSIFGSVQLLFLGILGEYIGVIFDEVKKRPRYILDKEIYGSAYKHKP